MPHLCMSGVHTEAVASKWEGQAAPWEGLCFLKKRGSGAGTGKGQKKEGNLCVSVLACYCFPRVPAATSPISTDFLP